MPKSDMKEMPGLTWRNGISGYDINLFGESIGRNKPVIVTKKDYERWGDKAPCIPGTAPRDKSVNAIGGTAPEVFGPYLYHPQEKEWFCRRYYIDGEKVYSHRVWAHEMHIHPALDVQEITLPAAVRMMGKRRERLCLAQAA